MENEPKGKVGNENSEGKKGFFDRIKELYKGGKVEKVEALSHEDFQSMIEQKTDFCIGKDSPDGKGVLLSGERFLLKFNDGERRAMKEKYGVATDYFPDPENQNPSRRHQLYVNGEPVETPGLGMEIFLDASRRIERIQVRALHLGGEHTAVHTDLKEAEDLMNATFRGKPAATETLSDVEDAAYKNLKRIFFQRPQSFGK
ncbi:MAG: hypothetical protein AAB551_04440 [Patescibacteria group bacterium]